MSIPLDIQDMSAVQLGASDRVDWTGLVEPGSPYGVRSGRAHLRILNESGAGLKIMLGSGQSGFHMPAGGWQDVELTGENFFTWLCETLQTGPTPNVLLVTLYQPGERMPPPPILGNSPVGISGPVATGGSGGTGTDFVKNDANAPATSVVEATPSDQGNSSVSLNNDASGFLQVLSANVLRKILNVVRGNATTGKAVITVGDAGDTSITTFYGQVGAGSGVPPSTLSAGALPAGVTVAPARLTSGALPGGVTIAGSQVSSQVASASSANSATSAATATTAASATTATTALGITNAADVPVPGSGASSAIWKVNGDLHTGAFFGKNADTHGITGVNTFTGVGAGTYSHGITGTPDWVGVISNQLNSTQTVGVDSLGSSTVHINMPNAWPFYAFAGGVS